MCERMNDFFVQFDILGICMLQDLVTTQAFIAVHLREQTDPNSLKTVKAITKYKLYVSVLLKNTEWTCKKQAR